MRLWTLHPRYLDRQGLTALWREALLAQAVLKGETRGYRAHPQLQRFQAAPNPRGAIATYLAAVQEEATRRGYHYDRSKIGRRDLQVRLAAATGQVAFEWQHLMAKLARRSPDVHAMLRSETVFELHPMFALEDGPIASWERP